MTAALILQLWRDESAQISSARDAGEWAEISMPMATLTDRFVRVFVRQVGVDSFLLSDCGDLYNDEYDTTAELGVSSGFDQAQMLLAKQCGGRIRQDGESFVCESPLQLLTSFLFDMAQFIQLAVNLAYLSI